MFYTEENACVRPQGDTQCDLVNKKLHRADLKMDNYHCKISTIINIEVKLSLIPTLMFLLNLFLNIQ